MITCPSRDCFQSGKTAGQLRVALKPTLANYIDPAPVAAETSELLGEPLHFALRIEAARGLLDTANRNIFVRYNFSDADASHSTHKAEGKHAAPQWDYRCGLASCQVASSLTGTSRQT